MTTYFYQLNEHYYKSDRNPADLPFRLKMIFDTAFYFEKFSRGYRYIYIKNRWTSLNEIPEFISAEDLTAFILKTPDLTEEVLDKFRR